MARSRLALPLLLALALVAPAALAATTRTLTISNATANESTAFRAFDSPAMQLADFDGDGRAEIVAQNENKVTYVLATSEPRVLAEIRPPYPSGWEARALNDPAVADVDGDGRLDVVIVTSAATVCDYEHDPAASTATKLAFRQAWCKRMSAHAASPGADAGAWVEDVTGDGKAEIFSQTETRGLFAFNADGTVRWSKNEYGGNAGPTVADLDRDGAKEVLFFSDGGMVRAFDAASGSPEWSFSAKAFGEPASIPVSGGVGDLDGDGRLEVAFITRVAPVLETDYSKNHFNLVVVDANGKLVWRAQPTWGNPLSYTHPVIWNGLVIAQDWNTIGHKPGNWERLGPAHAFAYTAAGALAWRTTLDNPWSNDDVLLADFDGDGATEVLAIGPSSSGAQGVWYLDARTGARETFVPTAGFEPVRAPVVGDFDGDGTMEWAISARNGGGGAILAYETGVACRVTYGGWQNRAPCDPPAGRGTAPPPPPPTSTFDATFYDVKGHEWWVQTKVSANAPIASVHARVDAGSWIALPRTSWGAWAKSLHVPPGSTVDLRATSDSGATDSTGPMLWPPGSSGAFTASFENVRGNEWWIETNVRASEPLAGVDARVDGGSWVALAKTSWGSWAKSLRADAGESVELRARSADGDAVVSRPYVWPP